MSVRPATRSPPPFASCLERTLSFGSSSGVFNFEVGVTLADGIASRLAVREDWPQVQRDLVHARFCEPQPRAAVRALYVEYGLEDVRDFYLDERVTVDPRPDVASFD